MTTISPGTAAEDVTAFCVALIERVPAEHESTAIDRIQILEKAKPVLEAAQARESAAFEQHRIRAEADRGVPWFRPPHRRGRRHPV